MQAGKRIFSREPLLTRTGERKRIPEFMYYESIGNPLDFVMKIRIICIVQFNDVKSIDMQRVEKNTAANRCN